MPAGGLGFECKMGPVTPPLWAEFTRHLTTHVGFQGAPTAPGVNPLVAGSQEGPGDSVVGDAKDSCYLFTILKILQEAVGLYPCVSYEEHPVGELSAKMK